MGTPSAHWIWIALIALVTAAMPTAAADEQSCHKLYRLTDLSHAIEPGIPVAAAEAPPLQ